MAEPRPAIHAPSDTAPALAPRGAAEEVSQPKRRLFGIDLARGLAVVGMFTAHFNPYQTEKGDWLQALVSGRSAALFALLAGISMALISGGSNPRQGSALRANRAHLATRAVLLFLLGLALTALGTPVKEILTTYGVLFLLAIPLLRVRPRILGSVAVVLAVAGPVLSFVLRSTVVTQYDKGVTPAFSNFLSLDGLAHLAQTLMLTGVYPVLTWLPFLLAGLAIGRTDLRVTTVRLRLLITGTTLAVLAYGTSWVLMNPLGGYARIAATLGAGSTLDQARDAAWTTVGVVPTGNPAYLLTTASHSGAPLEIFATIGLAMALIGAGLLLAERFPRSCRPLASIGALALTSYAGHILVLYAIGLEGLVMMLTVWTYGPLLILIAATAVITTAWRHWIGRGPLEWLLHKLGTSAGKLTYR